MSYQSVLKTGLFRGQTILVTGSGSGFGRCIAHELSSLGANILMIGRTEEKLVTVKGEIENDNLGAICAYGCADIRDADAVDVVIDKFIADHGPIHGLVNNAGGQFPADLENISPNGFLAVVRTNLLGGFIVSKAVFLKSMKEHGGAIVNITADNFGGMPRMAHSGAARAGMENLTQTAAVEWAYAGVRLNAVAPGYLASSGLDTYEDPEMLECIPHFPESVPLNRVGTESEVSSAVCFLLSEGASYINGVTLKIDGGSSLCLSSPLGRKIKRAQRNNEAYNGFHRATFPKILESKPE
ncbi:MAG: 2,4-dienoyl-CoA reductase [Gammaproteobacteria bacterium]|nr:MAG: 2,4-dienoyl-CoA reductase [Gammaproteobacteria bacterium]RLA51832.1 MAG: 2,4-dienoyl-CoA reductase [Gammaproteobacteria bacterium]